MIPSIKTCLLIFINDNCQVFINLESLRVLELNKNRLVEIPGLTFDGLKNVRVLKLKRNNLRSDMCVCHDFMSETNQRKNKLILGVRANWLPSISSRFLMDGAFYGLDSIEELYLDRNEVTEA